MNCEIIATHRFEKEVKRLAKKHISLREDLRTLYTELKRNPRIGTPLPRNGYKIRVLIKSKEKEDVEVAGSLLILLKSLLIN